MNAPEAIDALVAHMREAAVPETRVAARPTIAKVRYTHEDCVDCILANPGVSQNDLAARYGYSAAWISVVINSDVFQAKLAERRAELVDPVLRATIEERFRALAVRSLEVLQEKLSAPSHQVPDQLALQAAKLGKEALGLGAAPPPPAPSADGLSILAERLVQYVRRPPSADVVDVSSREVPRAAA